MLTHVPVDPRTKIGAPHTMRHTFCSRLVSNGVDIRTVTVKELAGHSSIATTMRYAHLADKSLAAAIRALENGRSANPVIASHAAGVAEEGRLGHDDREKASFEVA